MALDEQMQAAIQEDIADTRSKEDRLKGQMEGLTRMGVSAVASPILGAGDIVDVASSIPEMPPKAAVMFPTIAGLQSGFNAAKQAGLDRKKAEELIEYITGVELQGDSVELFGEIVGIPGGASILKGVTDVIKKYGDAAPKYINKIKAEAKELFRTASVGDDIDGMATATAGASRETVPTSVKPDLPDTSISPSIIEESTPSGSPAGNVVAKTKRKNKSPIRKLFDKLPQKERNALPTQPDENRIFGYHGTARARERDEPFFDINFARKNDQFLGEGFYFTLDPEIASEYSSLRAIGTVSNTPETRVTPKDLNFLVADTNIKPEYIRDVDSKKRDGFGNSIPTGSLLKTPEGQYYTISSLQKGEDIYGQPIAKGQSISRFDLSNLEKPYVVRTKKQREELQAKIPELKKEGYDSILFADFKDRSKQVMVFPEHMDKINSDAINYAQGGTVMKKQMELFEPVEGAFDEGGLMQEGGTVDPESGNEVPVGSTQEEVRDDIPAQLSEGEFVFPADVVRYIGLEKLMQMRQEAKRGLEMMDKMGQMGNSDEAVIPDDVPFDMSDLDMEDDGVLEFQTGGFVQPQGFTGIAGYQPSQFTGYTPQFTPYTPAPMPTGQTMAQQYTPAAQQFTPTIDQQAPTFTNLTGAAQPSPGGYDEMRTYVNDAGMEMQIPFKDGKPIYPIPEGYKVKGEAVDTTTDVKTETTQTAAPEQQDSGDEPSDPFPVKQNLTIGGTVVIDTTKKKEGELNGFKIEQERYANRY